MAVKQISKKQAIYSRKSKWTGKGESIENQITLCKEYLQRNYPHTDIVVYEDEGYSGGNLIRPQFLKMMEDARAGLIESIICYRLDRISRNIGDFAKLIEELGQLNISFISIKEQFDTGTPMGKAMMYIASVFSQLERETIAERIRDNMHELAKTGRWLGGTPPLGYRSEEVKTETATGKRITSHKLSQQDEQAQLVKLIFYKFLELKSLTKTETFLLQNDYKTRGQKNFSRFAIKNILTNPVYAKADLDCWLYLNSHCVNLCSPYDDFDGLHGILAYNRTDQVPHKSPKLKPMNEWIVTIGPHEGLISGRDWCSVQKILEENRSKSYRYRCVRTHAALLSGLLYCECGSFMRPKVTSRTNEQGQRIYSYVCELKEKSRRTKCDSKPLDGNFLDHWVLEMLKKKLSEDISVFHTELNKKRKLFSSSPEHEENNLSHIRKALHCNQVQIQNLVTQLSNAPDEVASLLLDHIRQLKLKENMLTQKIHAFEKQMLSNPFSPSFAPLTLSSFDSTIDLLPLDRKREIIRMLIQKIVWDKKNIHVYLRHNSTDISDCAAFTLIPETTI